MHIYLAGPYSANQAAPSVEDNVEQAAEIASEVFAKGHVAITPHLLTHVPVQYEPADELGDQFWYEATLDMMRRCDAVLLLPHWEKSKGARNEKEVAESLGMPVYEYVANNGSANGIPPLHPTEETCPEQCQGFMETIMQMYRTHLDKNRDYSPANIMGTGEIGLVTRIWDKTARLMSLTGFNIDVSGVTYEEPRTAKNEAIEDTYLDGSVYGIIAKLYRAGKWGK